MAIPSKISGCPKCPICTCPSHYQGIANLRQWFKCINCGHIWDEPPAYLKDSTPPP